MRVKVVKMYDDVRLPEYATEGSGCFDIYNYELIKSSGNTKTYSTGLKFEIPDGYVMLVYSRSGHGFKHNIRLANCVGVIDSDYRGELIVKLTEDGIEFIHAEENAAIAQGMIIPIPKVAFTVVDELSSTVRGEGGFGSTNK